jgi:hypothetical protein
VTTTDIKEEILVEESLDEDTATSTGVASPTSDEPTDTVGEDPGEAGSPDETEHSSVEDPGGDKVQGPVEGSESEIDAQGTPSKPKKKSKRQKILDQLRDLRREHLQNYTPLKANLLAKSVPFHCSDECPIYGECEETSDDFCGAERTIFLNAFYSYMEELNVDPQAALEVSSVGELATIDVLESRCLNLLSKDGILTEAPTFPMGDKVVKETSGNPTFEVLQILWRRRSQVRKELASTRDQKQKLAAALAGRKTGAEWLSDMMGMVRDGEKPAE